VSVVLLEYTKSITEDRCLELVPKYDVFLMVYPVSEKDILTLVRIH